MKREATEGHHLVGNNALRRTGHLKKTLQRINFGFQSSHFFFGSLSSASILCFEELTQFLYIVMLILETDLPWSHVRQEFGIQTTSIQCLDIFRQPWLKTLPARVSYLSSYISTSEKFLISMAHQDLLLHAPCWTSGSICKYVQRTCEHRQHVKWILMCNCLQVVRDVITPPTPLLHLSEICNVHVNMGNMSNAEMRARNSYMENLTWLRALTPQTTT